MVGGQAAPLRVVAAGRHHADTLEGRSESEIIYLVICQTQEITAKTTSGRCR